MLIKSFTMAGRETSENLPLHILMPEDIRARDGHFTRVTDALLDSKQENLAPFKDVDDIYRRCNPVFGAIYFVPNTNTGVDTVVHVARSRDEVPDSLPKLLAGEYASKKDANTSTYFSIINRKTAVKGSARPFLMAVVEAEGKPHNFTLSPMLDFSRWVSGLTEDMLEKTGIRAFFKAPLAPFKENVLSVKSIQELKRLDGDYDELKKLGAAFNVIGSSDANGKIVLPSPAAGFHLSNGASPARLCPEGDPERVSDSLGMMFNFKYVISELVANANALKNHIPNCPEGILTLVGNGGKPSNVLQSNYG